MLVQLRVPLARLRGCGSAVLDRWSMWGAVAGDEPSTLKQKCDLGGTASGRIDTEEGVCASLLRWLWTGNSSTQRFVSQFRAPVVLKPPTSCLFVLQMMPYRESLARLVFRRNLDGPLFYVVTYASIAGMYLVANVTSSIWGPLQVIGEPICMKNGRESFPKVLCIPGLSAVGFCAARFAVSVCMFVCYRESLPPMQPVLLPLPSWFAAVHCCTCPKCPFISEMRISLMAVK
jgi:hypothetical protein